MIPLFKSHFSIGKSILKVQDIFDKELDQIVLVEDSMSSFRDAKKIAEETGKQLIFGLRLETNSGGGSSKLIFFAKNNQGVDSLRRIYTKTFTQQDGSYILDHNDLTDVDVAVPFYDSFLHNSIHHFGSFELDLPKDVKFFVEDNNHPFDYQILRAINKYGAKTEKVKSIFYNKKDDFKAFQFYKAVCSRTSGYKSPTFSSPDLEHCCSNEFSWESYETK